MIHSPEAPSSAARVLAHSKATHFRHPRPSAPFQACEGRGPSTRSAEGSIFRVLRTKLSLGPRTAARLKRLSRFEDDGYHMNKVGAYGRRALVAKRIATEISFATPCSTLHVVELPIVVVGVDFFQPGELLAKRRPRVLAHVGHDAVEAADIAGEPVVDARRLHLPAGE